MEFKYEVGDAVRLTCDSARRGHLTCQYGIITALVATYNSPVYRLKGRVDPAAGRPEDWAPLFYESSIEGKAP